MAFLRLTLFICCTACLTLLNTHLITSANAAIIDLSLSISQEGNEIHTTVINRSFSPVTLDGLEVTVFEHSYSMAGKVIPAHNSYTHTLFVEMPFTPGSYPVLARLHYTNEGQHISLVHVGVVINKGPGPKPPLTGRLYGTSMVQKGTVALKALNTQAWRLITPNEIQVTEELHKNGLAIYGINTKTRGLNNSYPIFAVAEGEESGRHWTEILQARLHVLNAEAETRGKTANPLLAAMALLFLMGWWTAQARLNNRAEQAGQALHGLLKYTSRVILLSLAYLTLKDAPMLVSWLSNGVVRLFHAAWPIEPAQLLIEHLVGRNYEYFFQYFVDIYYWLSLLLLFPYLYYTDKHISAFDDKYVNTIRTLLTLHRLLLFKRPYFNELSRLGILTLCVKLFFAPMLVSWAINNVLHINNLIHTQTLWNLKTINSFIVDCLVLLDTSIFAFGYTIESRYLKNVIKSVEPTLLGWVVCLWCYPPFNAFSFRPFDLPFFKIALSSRPEWLEGLILCLITGLWGIFVWGSVALGFKGSNLTNRGIIGSGPYRFCRHPAYTAKVLVWWLEGIFFAKYGLSMLVAFSVIYGLRAWTEERHLSQDEDYLAYKRRVRWRCIPGLF